MHPPGICAILLRMENNTENEKDSRTRLLIGDEALSRLHDSHILLLGLGGVGSYVCEALCRAGVGRLSLVDSDMVEESNLNRQLYALRSTIGMPKTEAARSRCLDIAPDISIAAYRRFLEASDIPDLFSEVTASMGPVDHVIDAIDTVSVKIELAAYCYERDIPLISCCGTGNKLHPELFRIADIYSTSVCPLCRVMRRELHKRSVPGLTVCYSTEIPKKTGTRTPASISFVPSAAGLLIVSHVINKIIR